MGWRLGVYVLSLLVFALLGMLVAALNGPASLNQTAVLAVWAVIGPLLSAGASAYWQRRIAREDQAHAMNVASVERDHRAKLEETAYERNRRYDVAKATRERLEGDRSALIECAIAFLKTAATYSNSVQNLMTDGLRQPDSREKQLALYRDFASSYAACTLIADSDFAEKCGQLWNATFGFTYDLANPPEDSEQRTRTYWAARALVMQKARQLADSLRDQAIQIARE